jgi:hypothetical protein
MLRSVGFLTFALCAALAAPSLAAAAQAASDFESLCMASHGKPVDVMAKADAQGWASAPAVAANFAHAGESWSGREIHPASDEYRALAAFEGPFGKAHETKCYLVTKEPFEETAAALQRIVRFKPKSETGTATTWEMMEMNGVVRSTRDISPKEFDKPFRLGPQATVRVTNLNPGAILYFSEIAP